LHPEYVVEITGIVKKRPDEMVNKNLNTGGVEIKAEKIEVISRSRELPFPIDTDGKNIKEEIRLKYRYLDLRRPRVAKNIALRSEFVKRVREFLFAQDFKEIETPYLTQATPEGARDFIVPARLQPGKFFALPQSPQQYKQLLMVAGMERYFQMARCFRDEDLRADRGFEHTQIDMEVSFINQKDLMTLIENMITTVYLAMGAKIRTTPFPVINYKDALEKYGADKFDMRTDEEKKQGILAFAWVVDFPFFEKDNDGGWTFTHNPFSMPAAENLDDHMNGVNIENIKTQQYDLVCNGFEVGGGSIRAHKSEILRATYKIMGYSDEEIEANVGHMLKAFEYGTPPHGGVAFGIERLIAILTGETAIRETQAFPQTSSGTTAVMKAPGIIPEASLRELGIAVRSIDKVESSGKMTVFDRIVSHLNSEQVAYQTYIHKSVATSQESADIRGTDLKEGAKALIVKGDRKLMMLLVSAAKKLDLNAFKKAYGVKDLSLVSRDEAEKITRLKPGSIPPFGSLFELETYMDESLNELEYVVFNAGSREKSIRMKREDFVRIEKPEIGEFGK
jgi:aspartyl-tRNA synthetase